MFLMDWTNPFTDVLIYLIYLIAKQKRNYGMQRMQNQNDNRAKEQSDKLWWRAYGMHMKTVKGEDTND